MNLWLQVILGAGALAITVASMLIRYGESMQRLEDRVRTLDAEIEKLRLWRHDQANLEQAMPLLNHFDQRIQRLETRVFNGTPR